MSNNDAILQEALEGHQFTAASVNDLLVRLCRVIVDQDKRLAHLDQMHDVTWPDLPIEADAWEQWGREVAALLDADNITANPKEASA